MTCHTSALQSAEPTVRHAWIFRASKFRDNQLIATTGRLEGRLSGSKRFSSQAPKALTLDGKTNDIRVATITAEATASQWLPENAISVETWIYLDRTQPWGAMVSAIQDNGAYERGWMLGIRGDTFCFGLTSMSTQRLTYLANPHPFLPGNWYHVVGTFDGTRMRLYVDGRLRAESLGQKGKISYAPTGTITLGAYRDDNEHYPLKGQLAQAAIFAGSLSEKQVLQRFNQLKDQFPNVEPVPSAVRGWPTYGRDDQRSGYTPEQLQLPLETSWTYQAMQRPTPAWPNPAKQDFWHGKTDLPARVIYDRAFHVVSDGQQLIFASSSEDHVTCLEAATAKLRWRFTTEGPVRLAPTIKDQRVYFGSDDGHVYCLDLNSGKQVWKYQAAPSKRRIPGNQRMISAWPVRSGVMLDHGQARFAAGLFPTQGTYQFAVDAATGGELARGKLNFSPQGYLQRQGTRLMIPRGRNPVPQRLDDLKSSGKPIKPAAEKISSQHRYATIYSGAIRYAGGDGEVVALAADGKTLWSGQVEGKAYSLALAGGKLFVSTDRGRIHCFVTADQAGKPTHVVERPVGDPNSLFYRTTDERLAYQKQLSEIVRAAKAVDANPLNQGYCLVLGAGRGQLAYELAQQTNMQIIAVSNDPKQLVHTREALRQAGLYGRVVVHQGPLDQLSYANQVFNLVCCDREILQGPAAVSLEHIYQLLRPSGGVAVINPQLAPGASSPSLQTWAKPIPSEAVHRFGPQGQRFVIRRSQLKTTGDWTHMYAGPENTSCSQDQLVRGPLQLQWFGRPGPQDMVDRHHRTVPPLVVGGRMFLPGNNRILGVDAYNGTVLWRRSLADFRRVGAMRDSGSMVATADIVYAVANKDCYLLSAATGKEVGKFSTPPRTDDQPRHWGYIAQVGNELYGSTTQVGAARHDHSRKQIDETYYDFIPLVTSDSIFCRDRKQGTLRWSYQPRGAIVNPTITITEDRVFFVESDNAKTLENRSGRSTLSQLLGSGSRLVALDRHQGKLLWAKPSGLKEVQHHLFLGYAQGKLVAVGTRNHQDGNKQQVWYDIRAYSANDGKVLWKATQNQRQAVGGSHGEQDHHPAIVQNIVYVEPFAYHLETGARRSNWNMVRGGHGCGTISASATTCFFRAGHPTMCDLSTGKLSKVTQVSRPGCWINMIPAAGLLLIPEASSGCTCDYPIQTSMAFGPVPTPQKAKRKP